MFDCEANFTRNIYKSFTFDHYETMGQPNVPDH